MSVHLVVAGLFSHFVDDVEKQCGMCQVRVFHRPHAPTAPLILCPTCAGQRLRTLPAPPVLVLTQLQIAEVLEYMAAERATAGMPRN